MTLPVIALAQINPTVGDLTGNLNLIKKTVLNGDPRARIIAFPELSITGYFPEDLVLKPSFINACDQAIASLTAWTKGRDQAIIIGTPHKTKDGTLHNAAHVIKDGKILATTFKHELPNYGVFDERRYFTPGKLPDPVTIDGVQIGLMICEDLWLPAVSAHLKKAGAQCLLSINGSPYDHAKQNRRIKAAQMRVAETGLPFFYVNQVGGQDDLVYDGGSFALDHTGNVTFQAPLLVDHTAIAEKTIAPAYSEEESIYRAATLGLRDYIEKNGIKSVLLGLSGGIDSALVAAMAVDAIGADRVRCVMMPSRFTAKQSLDDAASLAQSLGIAYDTIPITPFMNAFETTIDNLSGLAHENMQSRLRGNILMTLSNQMAGAIVLTTGNKSEMATGYATLYGDMCGGYNPLKDIYKTTVFALAKWRGLPESIISRPPTAELREGQADQDSLPPYDVLDPILKALIEQDLSPAEAAALGHDRATVDRVARLVDMAEYKRKQAAPGPKITTRAFARERRYPITQRFQVSD